MNAPCRYDARTRVALRRVCHWLHVPTSKLNAFERMWAMEALQLEKTSAFTVQVAANTMAIG